MQSNLSSGLPSERLFRLTNPVPQALYQSSLLLHLKHPHHPRLLLPLVEQPVQVGPGQLDPPANFSHPLFPTGGHLSQR